jgi:hypothetical protein
VPVGINRNLNRAVPHLLLHVRERGTILNEQTSEGVPEVMEPEMSQPGVLEARQEVVVHQIVRVEDRPCLRVTPESVQKLQTALHDKAKEAPNFRFYALYDKVYRKDVLAFAYECCKANGGAAGVDGQTFEDIEAYGKERWLDELAQELKKRTYQPLPVRRVYIPSQMGNSVR